MTLEHKVRLVSRCANGRKDAQSSPAEKAA